MTRPWMQLYTRDWLDNKELRRCSTISRAVLIDLMCLSHEGFRYGFLEDSIGPLTIGTMAHRCHLTNGQFLKAFNELEACHRLKCEDGVYYVPRMVEDERIRLARASGGSKSVGHPRTHPPKQKEGYPSTHPSVHNDSCARMRADSDSDSDSKEVKEETSLPLLREVSEFPLTRAELAKHDPAVDEIFVRRLVQETAQHLISHDDMGDFDDEDVAKAIRESYATYSGRNAHGNGLLLSRVPRIIHNWGKNEARQ